MATKKIRKRSGGRTSKLNNETIENIEVALMIGATIEIASMSAGISDMTFYLWQREGKAVRQRLDDELKKQADTETIRTMAAELGEDIPDPYEPDLKVTPREALTLKFLKTIEEAEALGAMGHLQNINQASKIDPQLSVWILQNRHGYGRKPTEIIHKGDSENPVSFQDVSDMSLDERAARIALILQAAEKRKETGDNGETPDAATPV